MNAALFALLDTNKDGKLSREELAAAATVLAPLDADHDELLTPEKLSPTLSRNEGDRPFFRTDHARCEGGGAFAVRPGDGRRPRRAATALRRRYGRGARASEVPDGPADAEMVIRLGERAPGQARLEVLRSNEKQGEGVGVRPSADGATLTFDGMRIEIRVNDGRPRQPRKARQRTLDLFRGAAGDKGFLTRNERKRPDSSRTSSRCSTRTTTGN